jgi:hypothetical protein
MGLLVCLILQNDYAQTNVSCGDNQRITSYKTALRQGLSAARLKTCSRTDSNEGELPREHETDDGTAHDGSNRLNDTMILMSAFDETCQGAISMLTLPK